MIEEKRSKQETLVTRQPIFDKNMDVFCYELLFNEGLEQQLEIKHKKTNDYTLEAVDSFLVNGLKILSAGKKVFINFSPDMLLTEMPLMFPRDFLGIGIRELPGADKRVLNAMRKLKDTGYMLMYSGDLDSVSDDDKRAMAMMDIVGGDFRGVDLKEQAVPFTKKKTPTKFLAKSVETLTDYDVARGNGYDYFQGVFFCKSDLVPVRNIPSYKINFLKILKEINKPNVEFDQIEKILKKDVSITYKLLRFINSANFGFKSCVESIRHALTLLGERELRKWLSLIILSGTGTNKPQELINNTIIRAKFCESIAALVDRKKELSKYFLMGMFSMVDAFLDRPIDEILNELPLDEKVKLALTTGEDNRYRQILDVVIDYERGDWENFAHSAKRLHLDQNKIGSLYLEALEWAV